MPKENLNEPRLHSVTLGRVTLISLKPSVRLTGLAKVPGVGVLIGPGVRPILEQMLRSQAGVDVAQILNLSTKKISRLKEALGIPLDPREGDSETTAWRRQKAAEAAKEGKKNESKN